MLVEYDMGWLKLMLRQLSSIYKIVLVNTCTAKPNFVAFFGLVGTAVHTLIKCFSYYDRKPTNHLCLTLMS